VQGVKGVHDLHLWSVAGDDASLTAHVAIADGSDPEITRRAIVSLLEKQFNIHHATIQTETAPCGDVESIHT
jgi:cobalt-zinc-cadmium efflux system protein